MNNLVKMYSVEFMSYTNCIKDTVSHNGKDMAYMHVNNRDHEPFIISEFQIPEMMNWGGGIRTLKFIGYKEEGAV